MGNGNDGAIARSETMQAFRKHDCPVLKTRVRSQVNSSWTKCRNETAREVSSRPTQGPRRLRCNLQVFASLAAGVSKHALDEFIIRPIPSFAANPAKNRPRHTHIELFIPKNISVFAKRNVIERCELALLSGQTITPECNARIFMIERLSSAALQQDVEGQVGLNVNLSGGLGMQNRSRGRDGARGRYGARSGNGSRGGDCASGRDRTRGRELTFLVNRIRARAMHPQDHGPRKQSRGGLVQVLLNQVLNLFFQICRMIQPAELKTLQCGYGRLQKKLVRQILTAWHRALLELVRLSEKAMCIYRTVIKNVNIPCGNQYILPSASEVYGCI
jgi:hypothetical protein